MEGELGVGQQHRVFRPGQALAPAHPLRERGIVGEVLHRPVEAALGFQRLHRPHGEAGLPDAAALGQGQAQGLQLVVAQDEVSDFVGHAREQGVAGIIAEAAVPLRAHQGDLDVHLDIRGVDPGRVVDGVGVEAGP